MTVSPASIAAALGHQPGSAQWPGSGGQPVPMARFGKDHWGTFAHVEHWAVDRQGLLDHDRMRCSARLHPWMMTAKSAAVLTRTAGSGSADGAGHPTIVKGDGPDADGRYARAEIAGHDDYSCLDDLIAAGLLIVTMPAVGDDGRYVDARGRVIVFDGEAFHAGFLTGLAEKQLCAYAVWSLTEHGAQVASALRVFKANGGRFQDFTAPPRAA